MLEYIDFYVTMNQNNQMILFLSYLSNLKKPIDDIGMQ